MTLDLKHVTLNGSYTAYPDQIGCFLGWVVDWKFVQMEGQKILKCPFVYVIVVIRAIERDA